jgi:hypothetical protein
MTSFMRSSSPTRARSVFSMSWTASAGAPAAAIASRRTPVITRLELIVSLPPRRMQALPDLRQSEAMSTVTLGRLS